MPKDFALSTVDIEHLRTLSITEETLAKLAGNDPLTRLDWIEICLALKEERETIAAVVPHNDHGNPWLARLDNILAALAPYCHDIANGRIILKARAARAR